MFPKKLLPSTEDDILREISEEMNIPFKDVKKTFDIWLDYLEDIVENTDQCTINFHGFGKMYVSYKRMVSKKDPELKERKKAKIERDIPEGMYNDHKSQVPVSLAYGVGRINYSLPKDRYGYRDFFTKDELIRRQNNIFFKEDRDWRDRKDIFEKYFNDIPEQTPLRKPKIKDETNTNTKSETEE